MYVNLQKRHVPHDSHLHQVKLDRGQEYQIVKYRWVIRTNNSDVHQMKSDKFKGIPRYYG